MKNNTYQILGKRIQISLEDIMEIPDMFALFTARDQKEETDVCFKADVEDKVCYGIRYLSEQDRKIKNVFFSSKDKGQMLYTYEDDYSRHQLLIDASCTKEIFSELSMAGFYSYISLQSALLLHASAVCHQGRAIVFTAASGVGKTTQAQLWAEYKGAVILNGDKVFLKREKEEIHAWGSPWKGSSPYAENASAPLRAIVALEQAAENSIQKLEGLAVLEYIVPHVFFPGWDERCEQAVLTFLDQLLEETEVYLLKCRPDQSAVELLEAALKE